MDKPAPWPAHYEPGVPKVAPVTDGPFHRNAELASAGAPTFPALAYFGRTVSYSELDAMAERVATSLRQLAGFAPGAVVALDLPNGPHWAMCALGTLKAGAVVAPLGGEPAAILGWRRPLVCLASADRLAAHQHLFVEHGVPTVAVDPASAMPRLLRAVRALSRRPAHPPAGASPWRRWLARKVQPADGAAVNAEQDALVSRGPDGRLTTLSHRQLVAGAAALGVWLTDAVAGDETWLLLTDFGTPAGFTAGLGTALAMRAQVVTMPRWTGRDALDALRYTRPAYVLADAATIERLAAEPGLERTELGAIRAILVGDPLLPGVVQAFEEATGVRLCLGYAPPGMAGFATCNPVNGRRVGGSLGIPLPGVDARVLGSAGRPAEQGAAGALELAAAHGPPGWLRPGLVARQDAAGYLYPAG